VTLSDGLRLLLGAPVSVVGETSGASGLSAVALVMLVSVGGRSNCGLRREGGCKEEQ